jgi:hypothetical protein
MKISLTKHNALHFLMIIYIIISIYTIKTLNLVNKYPIYRENNAPRNKEDSNNLLFYVKVISMLFMSIYHITSFLFLRGYFDVMFNADMIFALNMFTFDSVLFLMYMEGLFLVTMFIFIVYVLINLYLRHKFSTTRHNDDKL